MGEQEEEEEGEEESDLQTKKPCDGCAAVR